ncbi:MAG: sigma-70 family RNA polymerase sigma factor [Pirellulaceae bacterium]
MNEMGPANEDARWIERSMSGDTEAFGSLVSKYQNRLYNSMVHFLRDETEAEDVVQESFVLSFTRLASFRGNSSFYTWLYRIAFNTAISRRRRRRPQVSVERDLGEAGSGMGDQGPQPGDRLDADERAGQLHAALNRLNEQHRMILVLREMDQLSYEEISEILDLPIGTVRSRLHRARSQLKEELASYFQQKK